MKVVCEIAEDLLPLYVDNVCSDQSKRAVEDHLRECEKCRKLIESTQVVSVPHIEPDRPAADQAVKKGFKKIRLRWWLSIALVGMIVPLACLGWNQYHDRGIHYSNLYEYRTGSKFMELLENGEYEKAYGYIDIDGLKQEWLEKWFGEEELRNIEKDGLEKFCELGESLEALGGIESCEYLGISLRSEEPDGTKVYQMVYRIRFGEKGTVVHLDVSDEGVEGFNGGGSFVDDPLARFSIWAEYLWQDYEGCWFDPNLGSYVYYDAQ